ncbi:MAG: ABC transporter permease, partial [Promethearchaeota archaeon]
SFITPFLSIFIPLIIMNEIFSFNKHYGPWTTNNFLIYQLLAYNILLLERIIEKFPNQFNNEKYWQTLKGIIIAPTNRFNLLFGIFFSQLVVISFPFCSIFIFLIILFPILFSTIIFIIFVYFLIALIFSGTGIILGVFAISNENISNFLKFFIKILFLISCITYPFDIFPPYIQSIIQLNPLYYIFDFLRLIWLENNVFYSIRIHSLHMVILISSSLILPFLGVSIFNYIYKKFGIVGY